MIFYFLFFFISGFCGILYELIWLRLAMAQFGVTTPLVSFVLSAFMAGMGAGCIGAGRFLRREGDKIRFPSLRLYAGTEFLIACSALVVPYELLVGHRLLLRVVSVAPFSSLSYYLASGVWIGLTLLPWCACMGATIPLAMFAIGRDGRLESRTSFSLLYLSNVLGAVFGAILPLFFIETHGFRYSLRIGASLNLAIAVSAFLLTMARNETPVSAPECSNSGIPTGDRGTLVLLFLTGFCSMGMEVTWIRMFTPFVGVMVYSFALILVCYLLATFVGSSVYRDSRRNSKIESPASWGSLAVLSVLPLLACDPRLPLNFLLRVPIGVAPFAAMVGYLTPKLIDRWSAGDAERAATGYSINVLGCILGPLVAGFIFLPRVSESWTLFLFAVPWLFVGPLRSSHANTGKRGMWRPAYSLVLASLTLAIFVASRNILNTFPKRQVLRDNTATVVAVGDGMNKRLLVNGVGMTNLTPSTKVMAHLPLAFVPHRPQSALTICFGMGTTYRSLLSWKIPATAVELVPSVPKMFWYYHADATELLQSPESHVIIDDGRRFLERTSELYDVITIDPPPPVEAAGSSLLYSREFYAAAKRHLSPEGVLQQWLPWGDPVVRSSVAQAIRASFTEVRVFHSLNGGGYHFIASDAHLPSRTAHDLAVQLPASADADFVEWGPAGTAEGQFQILLNNEISVDEMIADAEKAPLLEDDRPTNEYFAWRMFGPVRVALAQRTSNLSNEH